jgi:hypothetical protein
MLQYAEIPFWKNIQTPLPKQTCKMHIIAIWSTKGRYCLNACNKNWLKELAKEISDAKWKINYIHTTPTPLQLMRLLALIKKLPSDHLHQTPQGPQDKIIYTGPTSEL